MTFDLTSVEVTYVTLSKDHCVQVPWEYINVWGYSDQFCKTLTKITTYRMSKKKKKKKKKRYHWMGAIF